MTTSPCSETINVQHMNREEWLAERRQGLGSSDAAAILGLSPYKSPYQVWLDKMGQDEEEDNDWMEAGRELEPVVAKLYAKRFNQKIENVQVMHVRKDKPFLRASVDRWIIPPGDNGTGALEIKTASERAIKSWGGPLPLSYFCQIQHQLMVTGWGWGEVAIFVTDSRKIERVPITRDNGFIAGLEKDLDEFWANHILTKTPPPKSAADLQSLPGLKGKISTPDGQILVALEDVRKLKSMTAKLSDELEIKENQIKEFMQDAETLARDNKIFATYGTVTTNKFSVDALKKDDPKLYGKYLKPSTYRVFRLKKENDHEQE